ncbi:OsmC family protein [Deinococcus sp. QL22]|uniref:OsmC family protein n=1 Tax=Deinococcus sp. QL22 TaxID=2939437 RepID=UPI002016B321|nr:OsmC family protein [Deinococcus sp. QL22]UQN09333.1 OsmC family protein [Deinococcus sp. QL22]
MNSSKTLTMHHLGDQRYASTNQTGQQLVIDMSAEHRIGVGPMDALMSALASCTMYDVVEIMEKRRTPLSAYRVTVEGFKAEGSVPPRYERYVLRHVAQGQGISVEALEKAAHLSHEKYCTIGASLAAQIEIEVVIESSEQTTEI